MALAPVWFEAAAALVRAHIACSRVPEDPGHAEDTLAWLVRLLPDASWPLRLAALAHDLDRALPDARRVRREDFADYDDFKAAHAANSARVLAQLMRTAQAPQEAIRRACFLVLHHETGGADPELMALCDADALSFYTHNLAFYRLRHDEAEVLRRARWGVARLSPQARARLAAFPFADPHARAIVREALAAGRPVPILARAD